MIKVERFRINHPSFFDDGLFMFLAFYILGSFWTFNSDKTIVRYVRSMHLTLLLFVASGFIFKAVSGTTVAMLSSPANGSLEMGSTLPEAEKCNGAPVGKRNPASADTTVYDNSVWKVLIPFFAILVAIIWNLETVFGRKWSYCSDLYNKILEKRTIDENLAIQLEAALAIDILDLGMWSNSSFQDFFNQTVDKAIASLKNEEETIFYRKAQYAKKIDKQKIEELLNRYFDFASKNLADYLKLKKASA